MALHFELVSPEKLLIAREVAMAIVPGEEGDIGVLEQHMPLISTLRPGLVILTADGQPMQRFFVEGGFVEVTPASCVVLAEHAQPFETLDRGAAERALADAEADLRDARNPAETQRAESALRIARARLEALAPSVY
ncbi:MAG TPA: ATP synthase F1 subunit epsilon [Dongiaceae bacterium]|jgi:F-type H+-transporting ATPase subunit epsilon|nr:ATP synthase F1 subunit epsilon [Dongiaceae bacterium]